MNKCAVEKLCSFTSSFAFLPIITKKNGKMESFVLRVPFFLVYLALLYVLSTLTSSMFLHQFYARIITYITCR